MAPWWPLILFICHPYSSLGHDWLSCQNDLVRRPVLLLEGVQQEWAAPEVPARELVAVDSQATLSLETSALPFKWVQFSTDSTSPAQLTVNRIDP